MAIQDELMNLEIRKKKKSLVKKALKKGIWENFGQKDVRELRDKFGNTPEIDMFDNWAMNFDQRTLALERKLKKVI